MRVAEAVERVGGLSNVVPGTAVCESLLVVVDGLLVVAGVVGAWVTGGFGRCVEETTGGPRSETGSARGGS